MNKSPLTCAHYETWHRYNASDRNIQKLKIGSQTHTTCAKYRTRRHIYKTKQPGMTGCQPGELYKILYRNLEEFILQIMNNITHGKEIPGQWAEGAILHIDKKGRTRECENYRPIFITQIIYKIWCKLQTNRLAKYYTS